MGDDLWPVGILDEAGTALCGAGVLVSDRHILTCAHVIAIAGVDEPRADIQVQLVGLPGQPTATAHVRAEYWKPERPEDHCADVALLELDDAVPDTAPAQLRQMQLDGRFARAQGYPWGNSSAAETAETRVLAGATGPGFEWKQMEPRSPISVRVRHGFSGAGVVDEKTGDVVGIVIAIQADKDSQVSWMMPVEKIARHLPDIGRWAIGEPSADAVFVASGEKRISEVTSSGRRTEPDNGVAYAVRALVEALGAGGRGAVWNVIGPAEDRLAVLGIIVFLADPTSRHLAPEVGAAVPPDLVLPDSRVDLAVDARGRSTEAMASRILERLGLPVDEPDVVGRAVAAGAALTVVIDSVEEATDPGSLQRNLLRPIAAAAPNRGGRLIVGSRQAVLAQQGGTALAVGAGRARPVAYRLDQLDAVVAEIEAYARLARERYTNDGVPKFRAAPVVAGPDKLRLRITALRAASAGRQDDPRLPDMLAAPEGAADTALRRAETALDQLDAMLRTRNELRGLLASYKAGAARQGRVEDPQLARLYEIAYRQLHTAPCDLAAAKAAVDAYLRAVRLRLGTEDEEDS